MVKENFGTVEFENKELTLTQEAFADSDFSNGYESTVYKAHAVDNEGNEYKVYWTPVDNLDEITDESEACDWTEPSKVVKI